MKFSKIISSILFGTILFTLPAKASTPGEYFSYCSDGNCRLITTDFFYNARGMPRDTNFSCVKNNQYALTFDDGPSANYPRLLELLKKHNVKATFFVVGSNLEKTEADEWLGNAAHDGHFIANHTLNHVDLTSISEDEIYHQIEKSRQNLLNSPSVKNLPKNLQEQLEHSTKYLRPPFGNIDSKVNKVFKDHGYTNVRWNSDRYDWNMPTGQNTVQTIIDRVKYQLKYIEDLKKQGVQFNHSILDLNHDWQLSTLEALDVYIPLIKEYGYEFVLMDECLGN